VDEVEDEDEDNRAHIRDRSSAIDWDKDALSFEVPLSRKDCTTALSTNHQALYRFLGVADGLSIVIKVQKADAMATHQDEEEEGGGGSTLHDSLGIYWSWVGSGGGSLGGEETGGGELSHHALVEESEVALKMRISFSELVLNIERPAVVKRGEWCGVVAALPEPWDDAMAEGSFFFADDGTMKLTFEVGLPK